MFLSTRHTPPTTSASGSVDQGAKLLHRVDPCRPALNCDEFSRAKVVIFVAALTYMSLGHL